MSVKSKQEKDLSFWSGAAVCFFVFFCISRAGHIAPSPRPETFIYLSQTSSSLDPVITNHTGPLRGKRQRRWCVCLWWWWWWWGGSVMVALSSLQQHWQSFSPNQTTYNLHSSDTSKPEYKQDDRKQVCLATTLLFFFHGSPFFEVLSGFHVTA